MPDAQDDLPIPKNPKRQRTGFKGALTRMLTKLTPEFLAAASMSMLLLLEERVLHTFSEYERINSEIEDDEDPSSAESMYYECLDKIRSQVDKIKAQGKSHSTSKLKLPNIQINPFSGKYTEYQSFIEMFSALIDTDGNDDIQKFFYLKHFLRGEAYELVNGLPVVGSSFKEAMNILRERYDNKFKIVSEHINNLFDMPTLSKSSASNLRLLISTTKQHIAALRNLGEPVNKWDSILVCLLTKKLDSQTSKAYHLEHDKNKTHTFDSFIKFLEDRALAMENCEVPAQPVKSAPAKVSHVVVKEVKCLCCGKFDHKLYACPKFMLAPINERLEVVKRNKLCKVCLNPHQGRCKFFFKCQQCKQGHNTLLHNNVGSQNDQVSEVNSNVSLLSNTVVGNQTLLATAKVKVLDINGKEHVVRALLDPASQSSFITSELSKTLGKPILPVSTDIVGIAKTEKNFKRQVKLDVFSCVYPYKAEANCLVVNKITTNLPQQQLDLKNLCLPKNIKLADESFHIPGEIDILLAADIYYQALLPQHEEDPPRDEDLPKIVHTKFGYILGGGKPSSAFHNDKNTAVTLFCQDCTSNINDSVSQFWKLESVPETFKEYTSEQQYCKKNFAETVKLENNQFEVTIPLKIPIYDVNNTLGDSLGLALKRFINLEKRFEKDHQLFLKYKQFIDEYVALGHGTYIDISKYDLSQDAVYFLAHHPVIREDALTTQLRVVFDGSMRTYNNISLNDLMLNGPIVQQELFDILLSFRMHEHFFICDIRRMFRNILVSESQRSLQNILWRDNKDESIKCIQLNTITYGLKNSSYLATRVLKELATRYQHEFPLASQVLLNSSYVDDILHTDSDKIKLIRTKIELIQLLAKGSFNLHKWSASDKTILADIPVEQQNVGDLKLEKDIKTLGVKFDIESDCFKLSCPIPDKVPTTKREILSFVSQFYDPLGVAGPIFVQAKSILQKLWQSNVEWDSVPPPLLQKEWLHFYNDLVSMPPVLIKRNVCVSDQESAQLIGFADASIMAYGCAMYLRVTDKQGKVSMSLLCSKSRIAPKDKKLSVPRLELNSALLLAKLCTKVSETLTKKIPIQSVHLFSDSQVVLAWLKTEPTKLNAYVANRIKMITQYTKSFQWSYIKTDQNPADCLSRGLNPGELQSNELWFSGPKEMHDSNYNFNKICSTDLPNNLPELKASKIKCDELVCAVSQNKEVSLISSLLQKYSDINKATRILAYVLRFCKNTKPGSQKIKDNFVTFKERNQALHLFIKEEQNKYLSKDIAALRANTQVSSNLKGLNPFLDANSILRVSGRLQHSALPYSKKYQIILPKESKLTQMIIESEHIKLFHAGQKHVLCNLNQYYWIINGLRLVKKIIFKCVICFRFKGVTAKQLMGSLPYDRANVARAFEKTGIDFAGPVSVKQSRVRNVIITKGYITVYVCFVTKSVHLETVSDLTTEAFLASFKRFISRRNVPSEVYCDNASTFKAANTQLTELYRLNNSSTHQNEVQAQSSKLGITFHFIPAYSPVFAGLWEAAVKSVKHHLKRVLGSHVLTYEQLSTVLSEIEAILNSRPITPMSSDIEDLSFLTPGHFLTGAPLTCYPEQNIADVPTNRLTFWKKCTAIKQQFWRYWSKMYLNTLQNRPKWKDNLPNIKVGTLVILREIDSAPMTWPMARVTQVFPGQDGKVRALEVKKANGKCHRTSITKVCILPIDS